VLSSARKKQSRALRGERTRQERQKFGHVPGGKKYFSGRGKSPADVSRGEIGVKKKTFEEGGGKVISLYRGGVVPRGKRRRWWGGGGGGGGGGPVGMLCTRGDQVYHKSRLKKEGASGVY